MSKTYSMGRCFSSSSAGWYCWPIVICRLRVFVQADVYERADVEIAAAGFSNIDSAYGRSRRTIAINCGGGRVHGSPKKRLEPHRLDTFEFQRQFSRRAQEFIASQGNFIKP